MRFGRIPVVHVLIITVTVIVAIAGVKSQHFGIDPRDRGAGSIVAGAAPVAPAAQVDLLTRARSFRQQGRYQEAISALRAVIVSANPTTAGAALLETAKDDIALGNDTSAAAALNQLRAQYPRSPESDEAQFQLGQIKARRGDFPAAINDLQDYRKRHPEIAAYIDLLLASYHEKRNDLNAALSLAQSVASAQVASRTQVAALEAMREIQQKRKDFAGYLDATNRLLELATIPSYRAELIYERASAELHLGNGDDALADLRTIIHQYPDSGYATNAISDLVTLAGPTAVTLEQRGLVAYYRGDYQTAEQRFTSVLASTPTSDAAWYYRAMSQLKRGDLETAEIALSAMASRFPGSSLTPPALVTAGRLYEGNADLAAAERAYEAVITHAPYSIESTKARLRLGIVRYQTGDFGGVVSILAPVHGGGAAQAQASFWAGKAYEQMGDAVKAAQCWQDAELADPTGFYGLRSRQLQTGQPPALSAHINVNIDTSVGRGAEASLAAWFALNGTTEDAARAAVQRDATYRRLNLLFDLGLSTQAEWEISALADRYNGDPASLATLGELLNESGHYNDAYRVGIKLQRVSDNNGIRLPDALQRLAYPIAYPDLVQNQSSVHAVDPLLLLGLMRQESGYDPTVTSSADARGLTQIVPATATEIAAALDLHGWNAKYLCRPAIAIQFGALFLSDRLQKYDGQIFPALAGYNAGDGNVSAWISKTGIGDPDLFLERISFPETYDYVKSVYANYLNYVRLYH